MTSRIWVLGASDPEMEAIEHTLQDCDECYVYAATAQPGRIVRVNPSTAYKATTTLPLPGRAPHDPSSFDEVIFVECGGPITLAAQRLVVVDHHRPGDPGYGRPPVEFWAASSIGQVCAILGEEPWTDLLVAAAADHCPAAAYQGACPGIDPRGFAWWRARSRARHQRRSPREVMDDINVAGHLIDHAKNVVIGGVEVADMRPYGVVAELPEAALQSGRVVLAEISARQGAPGKTQVVLQGAGEGTAAGPEPIRVFLDEWAGSWGYHDLYGDPARGFAGGYR